MFIKGILTTVLLALSVATSWASEEGVLVALKIERNGEVISTPRVLCLFGQDSAVQIEQSLRVELNASDLGPSTDLKFKLYFSEFGSLSLVSSPRITAQLNKESAIQVTGKDGVVYRISVMPSKVARPS